MLPLLTLIRDFFRNHGLGKWVGELSDNDLRYLLSRAARAAQHKRRAGGYGLGRTETDGLRFAVDGRYFRSWQDVLAQFRKDLEGIELNEEQQDIYDVVTQRKDNIRLRIDDLNKLEDIFLSFGTRKKGVKKFISIHYAGLRNPVTALEVLNIGDVIRRGELVEDGTEEYPTSRRYELKAEDGATLKVIIDFSDKKDKNRSVINFYSDRKSDTGAHDVSSGIITNLKNNVSQLSENAREEITKSDVSSMRFSVDSAEDSRYSVAPGSEEESNKIALMEKLTGGEFRDDVEKVVSDFFDRFKVKIDVPEARYLMVQARSLANARRLSEAWDNAYNFYREDVPLFGFAFDEAGGKNMVLNPGREYVGTEFSGSFISPEFVKYSVKRPQRKGESDSRYRKYLETRKKALDNASGY